MNFGLTGRVALVTGSSRGIGRAIAEVLAAEGAKVAITCHTQRAQAGTLLGEIQSRGGEAMIVDLNLSDIDSIRRAADEVLQRWGKIDILVNNAVDWGKPHTLVSGRFDRAPLESWRDSMRSNIEGSMAMIQSVLPSMELHGWGRIVNISSISAEDGLSGGAWYTAAKAALHGLTRTLAKELRSHGILVNCVLPGLTLTDAVTKRMPPSVRECAAKESGGMLSPRDIALPVAWMCSEVNTAVSGTMLRVGSA